METKHQNKPYPDRPGRICSHVQRRRLGLHANLTQSQSFSGAAQLHLPLNSLNTVLDSGFIYTTFTNIIRLLYNLEKNILADAKV